MSRLSMRPTPSRWETLETATRRCPACGGRLSCHHTNRRAVVTLDGLLGLRFKVRRCVSRPRPTWATHSGSWASGRMLRDALEAIGRVAEVYRAAGMVQDE